MCDAMERGLLRRVFDLGYEFGRRDSLRAERELVDRSDSNVVSLDVSSRPILWKVSTDV